MNKKNIFILLFTITSIFILGKLYGELVVNPLAHKYPLYEKIDILSTLENERLSSKDYKLLYEQTGLSKSTIEKILSLKNGKKEILLYQNQLFDKINVICNNNSIISKEDRSDKKVKIAPLEDGDILITNSSHSFGWRTGHASLVVNAEKGLTLEAAVLGENSNIKEISYWEGYPNFIVLRLKNKTPELIKTVLNYAKENLHDIPYNLLVGILTKKTPLNQREIGTQCSHLVWRAFKEVGFDIDYDGSGLVTPKDIGNSKFLEVVQVYGFDVYDLWK